MITEQQRQERQKYLGGSDAAAVCGVDPWKGPLQVWESKVMPLRDESDDDDEALLRKRIGNLVEPVLLELASDRVGKVVQVPGTFLDPAHPWRAANLDGRVQGGADDGWLVECKHLGSWRQMQRLYERETPQPLLEHVFQVVHYVSVVDAPGGLLCYLVGFEKMEVFRIERDRDLEAMVLDRERTFWENYVLTLDRPPETHQDRLEAYLKRRYPTHKNADLIKTEEPTLLAACGKAAAARKALSEAKKASEAADNVVREFIADAAGFDFGPFGTVTCRGHSAPSMDMKALRADADAWALAERHMRANIVRPLKYALKDPDAAGSPRGE